MKLSTQQIQEILSGAVRVIEEKEVIRLSRFIEEQERLYREKREDL